MGVASTWIFSHLIQKPETGADISAANLLCVTIPFKHRLLKIPLTTIIKKKTICTVPIELYLHVIYIRTMYVPD